MERVGPYLLLDEIARGGMGVVFRGRHQHLERDVAVKLLLPGQSALQRQRFLREARAASRLQHPHIVSVHAVDEFEGRPYLVMDLIKGESLDRILERGPLPPRRAVRIARLLALALQHAHDHGILHRDLKPANVLLDSRDEPHLTDFGLAKDLSPSESLSLSASGRCMGTPGFWPPEQARGERQAIDARADVYALGGTLYAMLTGEPPHGEPSSLVEALLAVEREPAPASTLAPDVPPQLDRIVGCCLRQDPDARYASAQALADALDEAFAPRAKPGAGARWLTAALLGVGVVGALAITLPSQGSAPDPATSSAGPSVEALLRSAARSAAQRDTTSWADQVAALRRPGALSPELEGRLEEQGAQLLAVEVQQTRGPMPYSAELHERLQRLISALPEGSVATRGRWELGRYLWCRAWYGPARAQFAALVTDPQRGPSARLLGALAARKQGDPDAYWEQLRETWEADPQGAAGLTALAMRELEVDDPDEALRHAEAALAVESTFAPAWEARLRAQLELQVPLQPQPPAGLIDDDPALLVLTGRFAGALRLCEGRDPDLLLARAQSLTETQPEEAIRLAQLSLEQRFDMRAQILWGLLRVNTGQQEEGLGALRRAFDVNPGDALRTLGKLLDPTVITGILQSLEQDNRGLWLQPLPVPPSPPGVVALAERVRRVAPTARPHLERLLRLVSEGRAPWLEVEPVLQRSREAAPADPALALELVRVLAGRDHAAAALAQIERARNLEADPAELDWWEGQVRWRDGQRGAARGLWGGLVASQAKSAFGLCAAAEFALRGGDPDSAAITAQQVLERDPDHTQALVIAAEALWQAEPERALSLSRRAIELQGALDCRALWVRATCLGHAFSTPEGLLQMFMQARLRAEFARARRYASAACGLSGGAQPFLELARQILAPLADPQRALRLGATNVYMGMAVLSRQAEPLFLIARERAPLRPEVWQLGGALTSLPEERESMWARARELDPDLPLPGIYPALVELEESLRRSLPADLRSRDR